MTRGPHAILPAQLHRTPLHYAAAKGHTAVVSALVKHGAAVAAVAKVRGSPCVHCEAVGAGGRLDASLMRMSTVAATQDGMTPLHVAAEYNVLPETMAVLVELGADPDAKDGVRVVCLACAARHLKAAHCDRLVCVLL